MKTLIEIYRNECNKIEGCDASKFTNVGEMKLFTKLYKILDIGYDIEELVDIISDNIEICAIPIETFMEAKKIGRLLPVIRNYDFIEYYLYEELSVSDIDKIVEIVRKYNTLERWSADQTMKIIMDHQIINADFIIKLIERDLSDDRLKWILGYFSDKHMVTMVNIWTDDMFNRFTNLCTNKVICELIDMDFITESKFNFYMIVKKLEELKVRLDTGMCRQIISKYVRSDQYVDDLNQLLIKTEEEIIRNINIH